MTVNLLGTGVSLDEKSCEVAANRCATDVVERIRRGEW